MQETPEIIDSDVHDYDSKVNNSKVSGVFSKKIVDSDDEKPNEESEELKTETKEEDSNEESEELKTETKEEAEVEAEEKELAKKEVKKHIDKQQSAWGQFWKSEYNDIQNKEETRVINIIKEFRIKIIILINVLGRTRCKRIFL